MSASLEIEIAAMAARDLPLFIALRKILDKSYVKIIDCMMDKKRYDILNFLKEYTQSLLNGYMANSDQ